MTTRIITATVAGAIGLAALTGAAIAGAMPTSNASDTAFIDGLADRGLRTSNPAAAIRTAHAVCSDLADGAMVDDVLDSLAQTYPRLSSDDVAGYTALAVQVYCPELIPDCAR